MLHLKIQIDFFEPDLSPAIRQKLFYRGQSGLTPVKNSCISCLLGIKCLLICFFELMERTSPIYSWVGIHIFLPSLFLCRLDELVKLFPVGFVKMMFI